MAKHGWKKFADAHSNEKADEHMQKAAALISEAQSHLNAVRFAKQVVVDREHAVAAGKMMEEVKVAERTYHNYLVKQPLDRVFPASKERNSREARIHPGHQPEKFGADL